jgi:NADH-quinone oxidoreductase subunit D
MDHLPKGKIRIKVPRRIPEGEAVSRVEAPRGELIHYVKTNGTKKPERYKVRSPTLGNIPSLCKMLVGGCVADIPIIVAGIDPCFSCTDR